MSGKKKVKAKARGIATGLDIVENSFNSVLSTLGKVLKKERDTLIVKEKPVWATSKTHLKGVRRGDTSIPDSYVGARADWHDVVDIKARLAIVEGKLLESEDASVSTDATSGTITSATAEPYYPLDFGTQNTHLYTNGRWTYYHSTHPCLRAPADSTTGAFFQFTSEWNYTGVGGKVTAVVQILHSTDAAFTSPTVMAYRTFDAFCVSGVVHAPLYCCYAQSSVTGYYCPRVVLTIDGGSGVEVHLGSAHTTGDFRVEAYKFN